MWMNTKIVKIEVGIIEKYKHKYDPTSRNHRINYEKSELAEIN